MTHPILKPNFVREDERGLFVEAVNGITWEQVSYGRMKKGSVMGNHYHKETDVLFFVVDGNTKIDIISVDANEKESLILHSNEGVILVPDYSHAIRFTEDTAFILCKSKRYDKDNPDTFPLEVPEL